MTDSEKKLKMSKKINEAISTWGLKKQEFAQLMNVSPSVVTKWLSGSHNFTVKTLFEIESKLNIRLINLTDNKIGQQVFTYKHRATSKGDPHGWA